jgi:hypothetical protein
MAKRPPRTTSSDPAPPESKPKRIRRKATPELSTRASAESTADDLSPLAPSDDDIRRRAYQRYQERGGNHGQHFDDWLEAEKELKKK